MKKSYLKYVFIGSLIAVLILVLCFLIDFVRVSNLDHPIFCKRIREYWDGGSYECYGLFYKVNAYADGFNHYDRMEIGPYWMEFQP